MSRGSQGGIEIPEEINEVLWQYGNHRNHKLRSYSAAMKIIGNVDRHETESWLKKRAENSRPPFGRRERAMAGFRQMWNLQIFVGVHNRFNQERHLNSRENFKLKRAMTLNEWRQLASQIM